ncbi:MAG: ROK family protein [Bacteriovoracaceae bacterium]|jgi:fructokinase|nr:ROK family protein [Bacteriovoracaceae bacterium]
MKIGIDLGGTKIEIRAFDQQNVEVFKKRVKTPSSNYFEIIKSIQELVEVCAKEIGVEFTVGIGIPGTISPATGLVKNANTTCLIGKPFDKDLEQAIKKPIRIANDANCFALSEAVDGAAKDGDIVFGVILGTGVGGGLVIGKKAIVGCNSISGEWGHNPLPWSDSGPVRQCYCGKKNCIESYLSGPALEKSYFELAGKEIEASVLADLAESGDVVCLRVLKNYELMLAKALAHMINIVDPDVVVLGGGLSNLTSLYKNVPSLIEGWAFSDSLQTKLLKAKYGDSSGVRGAAWLWDS